MIKYRLKKNLPCAKAGEIFREDYDKNDDNIVYMYQESYGIKQHKICLEDIDNFDEWFEEDVKIYFTIDFFRKEIAKVSEKEIMGYAIDNVKSLGLLFKTKEEAEKYLKYLKAKAIIKQDTNGFKPNWNDTKQIKYSCSYDEDRFTGYGCVKPVIEKTSTKMGALIYFKSEEDIKKSLKKHPKEWNAYLTYEQ
jgi:hypothetical protein